MTSETWDITHIHLVSQALKIYEDNTFKNCIVGTIRLTLPNWIIDIESPTEIIYKNDFTELIYNVYYRKPNRERYVSVKIHETDNIHEFLQKNNLPPLLNYDIVAPNINYCLEKEDPNILKNILSVILSDIKFKITTLSDSMKHFCAIRYHWGGAVL